MGHLSNVAAREYFPIGKATEDQESETSTARMQDLLPFCPSALRNVCRFSASAFELSKGSL